MIARLAVIRGEGITMHRRLTPLAGSIIRRLPLLLLLLPVGATPIGARCIERTSSHIDADGY
jgi:hypothetical protein